MCIQSELEKLEDLLEGLNYTVFLPLAVPPFYALVLIGEAFWRFTANQLNGAFP